MLRSQRPLQVDIKRDPSQENGEDFSSEGDTDGDELDPSELMQS